MGYLDDSILLENNYDECKAAVLRTVKIKNCINCENCINSKNMTLKLTKQKCNKILENLELTIKHANNITIMDFSKILVMQKIKESFIQGL